MRVVQVVLCCCTFAAATTAGHAQGAEQARMGARTMGLDAKALEAVANNRPNGMLPSKPVVTPDGMVRFGYRAVMPQVICSPLHLCDIELQAGERIQSLQIGDETRWSVEIAATGSGPNQVQHVVVRPGDIGIETSMLIATDRRTYRIRLKADKERYMLATSFVYPSTALERLRPRGATEPSSVSLGEGEAAAKPQVVRPLVGSMDALSFDYVLEGDDPPWKPVRVYNDGLQTVIEMPFAVRQTEAPALLVVRTEAGPFSEDEVVQVNYRVHGQRYVVDNVFDIADLIAGVGESQQRVRIRRSR